MSMKRLPILCNCCKRKIEKGAFYMEKVALTTGQKALMTLYNEEDFCVNLPFAFQIRGKLDKVRLEQALQQTIDDNDVFRFQFEKDAKTGMIYQFLVERVAYRLDERIPAGNTYAEKYEDVKKQVYAILQKAKGLFNSRLWDFVLFDMGDDTHLFFARINHLICDGVSIVAVLSDILSHYNGVPVQKSQGFAAFMKEQEAFQKTPEYAKLFQTFQPLIESYQRYQSFITYPKENRKKTKEVYFTSVESSALTQFCKVHKMSLFHVSLFLYHAAISAVYNKADTMIIVPIGTRKTNYRNTVGYLVSACYSRLLFENDTGMQQAAIACRNHFLESAKIAPIFFDIYVQNGFPHEFLLTYQNQMTNAEKKIPFGEAFVEPLTDPDFNPQEVETNVSTVSGVEKGDKIVYTLRADEDTFPPEMREKAAKAFALAARCLVQEDMTFGAFCKVLQQER